MPFPDMSRQNQIGDREPLFCCLDCTVLKIEFFQQHTSLKTDINLQEFGFKLTSSEAVPRPFSVATSDFFGQAMKSPPGPLHYLLIYKCQKKFLADL